MWQFSNFGARAIFYYSVFTKTPNLNNVKYTLAYIDQYPPTKRYQRLHGIMISILLNKGEKYCDNSPFLELEPIIILFCVHQDTGYEQCKIYFDIYQPIFNQKNISKALWGNGINTLKYGEKILWQFLIFMESESFFFYLMITKTMNRSNVKYKWSYLN